MPGVDIMPLRGRPLNIQILPASLAEEKYQPSAEDRDRTPENSPDGERRSGTQGNTAPKSAPDDLVYHGGKVIPNLSFMNVYVNGNAWEDDDVENIDRALAAAMSEPSLNNVLAQYFNTFPTSSFVRSQKLDFSTSSKFAENDVDEVIRKLKVGGILSGFDLTCTAINLLVPRGVVVSLGISNSRDGLAGYHGSVDIADVTVYYAVTVYAETADGQTNGIPVFDASWKNVVAVAYHQLNEIRTDPDVRKAIETGEDSWLGWMGASGECGDPPMRTANPLSTIFKEVPVMGGGTAPVQLLYSNYAHGPEGPIPDPHQSLFEKVAVNDSSKPGSLTSEETIRNFSWALTLSQGTRIQDDFSVDFVKGYQPTIKEKEIRDRINNCVAELVAITNDGTPRGQQLIADRDANLKLLREGVEKLLTGEQSAENLLFLTYKYEGKFEEVRVSLDSIKFTVTGIPDPQRTDMLIGVHYGIGRGKTTKEQLDLKRDIDKAVTVVKRVMQDGSNSRFTASAGKPEETQTKRHEYIQQLVGIGRVGLTDGDIELAKVTLETLKDEFVTREAAAVKNYYVRRLGIWAFVFTVVFAVAYAVIGGDLGSLLTTDLGRNGVYRFRNFLPLAIGASVGAWLAFLIRRPVLGFTDLVQLDDDLLNPVTRVVFTIVLSLVIGVLFWTGMVAIKIGGFSTEFENDGLTALLIGAFCGLASRALATAVSRRAEDFAGNVGGTAGVTEGGSKGL
jgi:hypothetical protein